MKFIDLFAGLGGFHMALTHLGHDCVLASELDPELQNLYEKNFRLRPVGDIRSINTSDIPEHQILCAGFPCQPFSKAGDQEGLNDLVRGTLFDEIIRIVRSHRPEYLILENVPNLRSHDRGATWQKLEQALQDEDYDVADEIYSPHDFGIPQHRERVFIVAARDGLAEFAWPIKQDEPTSITSVLDIEPTDAKRIPPQVQIAIDAWQDFIRRYPTEEELPSFPIWSMEFGATYPYEDATPFGSDLELLHRLRGAHGTPLSGLSAEDLFKQLPSHARTEQLLFPRWKRTFIRQNRNLYERHREWIDEWRPKLAALPPSLQKFEWNAKGNERDLSQHILQVRASGLRVKRSNMAPSLVAMTTTQIPIIPWEGRYMTLKECARLQSMEDIELPGSPTRAFAALGNAVNVEVVKAIAEALLPAQVPVTPQEVREVSSERETSPTQTTVSRGDKGVLAANV